MKTKFNDISELFDHLFAGDLLFENEEYTRTFVNSFNDGHLSWESFYTDLKGFGGADNLDEWFYEVWADSYNRYSVLTSEFDVPSVACEVIQSSNLHGPYTSEDAQQYLGLTLAY